MVPGSGVLTNHFSPGISFPLADAVSLMIAHSDNTATNLVLDKIGIASVGKRMKSLGFPHTSIYAKVFKTKHKLDRYGKQQEVRARFHDRTGNGGLVRDC